VPEAEVRDYVMVHVGFAISRVDADEAQRTYEILEQLGALEEELGEESAVARPVPITLVASGYLVSICGESFEAGESLSTAIQRKLPELKARCANSWQMLSVGRWRSTSLKRMARRRTKQISSGPGMPL
jgi:HupF/HypC family protein